MYKTGYGGALTRNKIKPEDLFAKQRASYDQVVKMEADLAELHEDLKSATAEERAQITGDIDRVEKVLAQLDAALVKQIDKHNAQKANVQKMTDARLLAAKNKKAAGGTVADPAPTPAPAPAPAVDPAPAPAPAAAEPVKKKYSSWIGWAVGTVLGIGALYMGVSYYQRLPPFKRRK